MLTRFIIKIKQSDKQSKLLLLRERALEHASAYPVSNSSSQAVFFSIDNESKHPMSAIPLSKLSKGAVAHIDSIVPNPTFGELDPLVTRRLADLGFSGGMPLQVIAVGGFGRGPFAVRLGNQSQFSLRQEEAGKIMCHVIDG